MRAIVLAAVVAAGCSANGDPAFMGPKTSQLAAETTMLCAPLSADGTTLCRTAEGCSTTHEICWQFLSGTILGDPPTTYLLENGRYVNDPNAVRRIIGTEKRWRER